MKKQKPLIFGLALFLTINAIPLAAQGRGGGKPGGPGSGLGGGPKAGIHRDHDVVKPPKTMKSTGKIESKSDLGARIENNPKLADKLHDRLPAGMSLRQAADGFRNQGQFIAALNVSENLNIPFDQLKARMTGNNPMSLGASIRDVRPELSEREANDHARRAEKEAKDIEKADKVDKKDKK